MVDEFSPQHLILMIILVVMSVVLVYLSIKFARNNKEKRSVRSGLIIMGLVIFAMNQVLVVLDHLELITFDSFYEHLAVLIAIVIVNIGSYKIYKSENKK